MKTIQKQEKPEIKLQEDLSGVDILCDAPLAGLIGTEGLSEIHDVVKKHLCLTDGADEHKIYAIKISTDGVKILRALNLKQL